VKTARYTVRVKTCKTCKIDKPEDDFYLMKHRDGHYLRRAHCKLCLGIKRDTPVQKAEAKARNRAWIDANRDQWNAIKRRTRARNAIKAGRDLVAEDAAKVTAREVRLLKSARTSLLKCLRSRMVFIRPLVMSDYQFKYWSSKRYRNNQIEKAQHRKRVERLARDGSLRGGVSFLVLTRFKDCCYCGVALTKGTWSMDHLIPIARGGRHAVGNVIPSCRLCNSRRRDIDLYDWLDTLTHANQLRARERIDAVRSSNGMVYLTPRNI
jgi:5-methylcytosine-specific restriction endonuclease McrA